MQKPSESNHLILEIDPELLVRIEAAAAERGLPVHDFIVVILRATFATNGDALANVDSRDWSRLSVPVFARDWDSDAGAVYDDLA